MVTESVESLRVEGQCDERFAGVRAAFEENFRRRGELGAGVCVKVGGRIVVDLWGGWADAERTRPWERDTLVNVWSTSKGVLALGAHLLADRGLLNLDAPMASYWPEFAQAGKGAIRVREVLSHRAGLSGLREPITPEELYDWKAVTDRLAVMEPWWEPGSRFGYHVLTYGYLVGEIIRRVTGLLPGDFLQQELTGPLGIDFSIGLPAEYDTRVADLVQPPPADPAASAAFFSQLSPMALAGLVNPVITMDEANSRAWRGAQIPAANGHATARAIADLYGIFASRGVHGEQQILSAQAVDRARTGQGAGRDLIIGAGLGHDIEFALGVCLSGPHGSYGPNPRAFGHDGFGGSCGLADPEAEISIGYAMNHMGGQTADDPRKMALVEAAYAAL